MSLPMHAIYSAANSYRLVGFVAASHRDRLGDFLDPAAGCYASRAALPDETRSLMLRDASLMEGFDREKR